jgi:hypothetical protein
MTQALRSLAPGGDKEESPGTRHGTVSACIYDSAMNREGKLLLCGLARP